MPTSKTIFTIFFFFTLFTILFFSCSNANNQNNTKEDTIISLEKGAKIFKKNCVACHGINGDMGLNGAANLTVSTLTLKEKIEVITHGRKTMLSFQGILKPHEIESVAQYIEKFRK